jgi:hypothetical protein
MNPQIDPHILALLMHHYGLFGTGGAPETPVMPTPSPAGLLDTVGATPNYGGMNAPIPAPQAAALPASPMPGLSFGAKYGPMFQTAANILGHHSAPAPQPMPFLHPMFWHPQGGGY